MKPFLSFGALALIGLLASCHSKAAATNLLCSYCATDADCGGNPCFVDQTGTKFCGAPCGSCPSGYDCEPVQGTTGTVVESCFPHDEICMPQSNGKDLAAAGDFAGTSLPDLANADLTVPNCTAPSTTGVTTSGGTVDRLFFGYTGDTRPANDSSGYPSSLQMVINNIFTQMATKGVQFAMDGGDHMEASNSSEAMANIADYGTAAALLGKPVFMTMGNHECVTSFDSQDCGYSGAQTQDVKFSAYMAGLQTISKQTTPYYRFDIMTSMGKAVFLVVADDAWNSTQESWLTAQLTDADANAKYTFVSKHHPDGNTDQANFQTIYNLVTSHKYTLFLTGHSHEFKRQSNDPRSLVMGLGGAPFDNPNQQWWGYLTIMQCPDTHFYVTVYDQSTGNAVETFNVPPQ